MENLPNNLRGRVAKLEGIDSIHLLILIIKFIRNFEESMIREYQIFNLYSGDLRKKWLLLKISEYFFRENKPGKFSIISLIFPFGCIPVAFKNF